MNRFVSFQFISTKPYNYYTFNLFYRELQNNIADQLNGIKDIYVHEENSNPQVSLVQGGHACSSPTSTSSRESNLPTSWHDISDVSLSTLDQNPSKNRNTQIFLHKTDKMSALSESHIGNLEKKQAKNIRESQNKDSANLDFISLPAGESSLTILPSYNLGCTDITQSGKYVQYVCVARIVVNNETNANFCF